VLVDLAVMLSDGGEAISDLAVLRDQPDLFGPVASTAKPCRRLGQHRRDRLGSVAPSACGGLGRVPGWHGQNLAGVAGHQNVARDSEDDGDVAGVGEFLLDLLGDVLRHQRPQT
jgi:hypothetical protein